MAHITVNKQFGNATMIPQYYKKIAEETMIKNVTKLVEHMGKEFFIPFNLKTYIKQGGEWDFYNTDTTQLAVKCDGIYMGSGWGLVKIGIKDIITSLRTKLFR